MYVELNQISEEGGLFSRERNIRSKEREGEQRL